jgi:hypothetical protein
MIPLDERLRQLGISSAKIAATYAQSGNAISLDSDVCRTRYAVNKVHRSDFTRDRVTAMSFRKFTRVYAGLRYLRTIGQEF